MNSLAKKFFQSEDNFAEVIFISDEKRSWEDVSEIPSDLPRGWFELSQVKVQDRIEFIRDFWLSTFPFNPGAHPIFTDFFNRLDDIAVVIRKEREEDFFSSELIYSLRDESTFFRGLPPPTDQDILELKKEIPAYLPRDYLSFLQVHNGFGKLSELGVLKIEEIPGAKRRVIDLILKSEETLKSGESVVDPGSLVPFFEAYGLSSFQCFYSDWYPGSEMGNVYLSGIDYTISDVNDRKSWGENLAFPTFLDWLAHYLQGMNFSF